VKLHAAVGVDHQFVIGASPAGCHAERVEDECGGLGAVDRPADHEPRERVEDDGTVDLVLPGQ
jgi:hypothetical protein